MQRSSGAPSQERRADRHRDRTAEERHFHAATGDVPVRQQAHHVSITNRSGQLADRAGPERDDRHAVGLPECDEPLEQILGFESLDHGTDRDVRHPAQIGGRPFRGPPGAAGRGWAEAPGVDASMCPKPVTRMPASIVSAGSEGSFSVSAE